MFQQGSQGFPTHRYLGYPVFLAVVETLSRSVNGIVVVQVLLFAMAYRHVVVRLFSDYEDVSGRTQGLHFIGFVAFMCVLGGYNLTVLPQSFVASLLLFQVGFQINRSHLRWQDILGLSIVNSILLLTIPISAFVVLLTGIQFIARKRLVPLVPVLVIPFVLLLSSLSFQISIQHRAVKLDITPSSSPSALGFQGDPLWRFLFTGTWNSFRENPSRFAISRLSAFSTILGIDPPFYAYRPYVNSLNGGPNDAIFSVAPQLHLTSSCRLVPSAPRLAELAKLPDSERYNATCAKPLLETPGLMKFGALVFHKLLASALLVGLILFLVLKRSRRRKTLVIKRWPVLSLIFFWCTPYAMLADTSDTASLARYGAPLRPIFMIVSIHFLASYLEHNRHRDKTTSQDDSARSPHRTPLGSRLHQFLQP